MGCHFLLQGIFPTQGSNPGLPHWKQMLLTSEPPGIIFIYSVFLYYCIAKFHHPLQSRKSWNIETFYCISYGYSSSPLIFSIIYPAAAAAKSLQRCPTLCDPIDSSSPGSSVPGILQARTPEWVAISFSNVTYPRILQIIPSKLTPDYSLNFPKILCIFSCFLFPAYSFIYPNLLQTLLILLIFLDQVCNGPIIWYSIVKNILKLE